MLVDSHLQVNEYHYWYTWWIENENGKAAELCAQGYLSYCWMRITHIVLSSPSVTSLAFKMQLPAALLHGVPAGRRGNDGHARLLADFPATSH